VRAGFTFIELIFVLAIIAVLAAIGIGTTRNYLPRFRTMGAGRQMQADIEQLRSLAVSSGKETRLLLTGSGGDCSDTAVYGGSWKMEIGDASMNAKNWDVLPPDLEATGADTNQADGIADLGPDGNRQSVGVCFKQWEKLTGPGTHNEDAIVFSPRGWVTNPFSDFNAQGYLVLTFQNQQAAQDAVDDEVSVTLSRSGNVKLSTSLGGNAPTGTVGTSTASSAP